MNANSCKTSGFEDLIVSYIYDEATADERRQLEMHILDCSSCMEEFAGLSNARLFVFEWQRESFAPLATPVIYVPDPLPIEDANPTISASWLGRLQALLVGLRGPALAFGAALVMVAAGLLFWFLPESRPLEQPAVAVVPAPGTQQTVEKQDPVPATPSLAAKPKNDDPPASVPGETPRVRTEPEAVRAAARVKRSVPNRSLTAKVEKPRRSDGTVRKAPVLSDYDEAVDRSLTLTDLFDDEIGSIRY